MTINGKTGSFARSEEKFGLPGHGPVLLGVKLTASAGIYPLGLVLTRNSADVALPLQEVADEVIGAGEAAVTAVAAETIGTGEAAATAVNAEVLAAGDGSVTFFTGLLANDDIDPGSVEITATVSAGAVTMTDNGAGRLSGDAGAGTIDYATGMFTLVFGTAPDNATNVTVDYDHTAPAMTFSDTLANTSVVPGSVVVTDGVEAFADDGAGVLTGAAGGSGTVNYTTGAIAVTFAVAPTEAADVAAAYSHTPPTKVFAATLAAGLPVHPGSVSVTDGVETFADDGAGRLVGSAGGTGTIEYKAGLMSATFNTAPAEDQDVTADYITSPDAVLDEEVDTAASGSGNAVIHGTGAKEALKVGVVAKAAPSAALLKALRKNGIYPI